MCLQLRLRACRCHFAGQSEESRVSVTATRMMRTSWCHVAVALLVALLSAASCAPAEGRLPAFSADSLQGSRRVVCYLSFVLPAFLYTFAHVQGTRQLCVYSAEYTSVYILRCYDGVFSTAARRLAASACAC